MHYTKVIAALRKFQSEMPLLVGNEMVNFALDNIRKETSAYGVPFKPRSSKAKRNKGRRLLIDRGDGWRSIQIAVANRQRVEVTANDYMQAHNTGFEGPVNVREHKRTRYDSVRVGTGSYSVSSRRERTRSTRVARIDRGTVRSHTRNMNLPRRTFLAPGQRLNKRLVLVLTNRLNKLLR